MNNQFDIDNLSEQTAVDKIEEAADKAQTKIGETAEAVKDTAKRAAAQVGEQAKHTVDTRRAEVAQELGSVADVVRQTAQEVGYERDVQTIARYGERIAGQIEGISSYLNEHDVEDVLNDVQDFARRQPAVFLGGAFMLGILIGRFLRSSGDRAYGSGYGSDRYRSDYTGGSATGDYGLDRNRDYTAYQGESRYRTGSQAPQVGTSYQDPE